MRERAGLFLLAAATASCLLAAVSRQQTLIYERSAAAFREKELVHQVEDLRKQLAEGEREKLCASQKVEMEARAKEAATGIKTLLEKAEALSKEAAARDQGIQALATKLQTRIDELSASMGEMKGQLSSNSGRAALEAKLKENEALLAEEREHHRKDIGEHEADVAALRNELDTLQKDALPSQPPRQNDERPPPLPPVSTTVVAMEPSTGVAVLGAGKKSGLEPGHVLSLIREGRPIGRVKVLKVYDDLAGAEVLETSTGETIRVNDRAETGASRNTERKPDTDLGGKLPLDPSKKGPPPPPLPEAPSPSDLSTQAGGNAKGK